MWRRIVSVAHWIRRWSDTMRKKKNQIQHHNTGPIVITHATPVYIIKKFDLFIYIENMTINPMLTHLYIFQM